MGRYRYPCPKANRPAVGSLCDYSGKVAAVIFTQGCNFRCPFCHNRDLLPMTPQTSWDIDRILAQLATRRKCIDSIVVTGGEPTVHADLPELLEKISTAGLSIKLDTKGSNPAVLGQIIQAGLIDSVAMDVKALFAKYTTLAGVNASHTAIREASGS